MAAKACVLVTIYRRESDLFALLLREKRLGGGKIGGKLTVLCDMTLDDAVHLEPQRTPLVVKVVNTCERRLARVLFVSITSCGQFLSPYQVDCLILLLFVHIVRLTFRIKVVFHFFVRFFRNLLYVYACEDMVYIFHSYNKSRTFLSSLSLAGREPLTGHVHTSVVWSFLFFFSDAMVRFACEGLKSCRYHRPWVKVNKIQRASVRTFVVGVLGFREWSFSGFFPFLGEHICRR